MEAPGRPLTVAFTSRSVNLSWAPPFNADDVGVDKYLIEIRAGEETSWKDGSILPTPDNVTLHQVNSILYCWNYKSRDAGISTVYTYIHRALWTKSDHYMHKYIQCLKLSHLKFTTTAHIVWSFCKNSLKTMQKLWVFFVCLKKQFYKKLKTNFVL